jgi:hypothetical protein
MGPLWFMRAGSRFGVHFFESAFCIESIVKAIYKRSPVFDDCASGDEGETLR